MCSSGPHSTLKRRDPNGDHMKMKSAKKKSLRNKAKRGEKQHDMVIVKTESELEEGSDQVYTNGDGFNIQIKEEPHSQEISGGHSGDPTSCADTKPDTVTSRSDVQHQQAHVKEECESDHQPEYEFAAVKEESESWIKEERGGEEEAGDAGNLQEDYEEEQQVCTGRRHEKHTIPGYCLLLLLNVLFGYSQGCN